MPICLQHPQHRRYRFTFNSVTLSLVLFLSACASWTRPDTPPAATQAQPVTLNPWWLDFQDPLLTELIVQAIQANPTVLSSQAALRQARALRDVQVAATRPSLSVSGSAQRSGSDAGASINFRSGIDASWELDIFGANQSAVANSEAEVQVARANLRDVQLSLSAEVALAYIQWRGLQAQLSIAERNLTSQQETLQITQWRAQAGLLTSLEVEQAKTAVAQTQAQRVSLQSSLAKTGHSLAVLGGRSPKTSDAALQAPRPIPTLAPHIPNDIAAEMLRQRADVRAAEARITASLAAVDAAEAARKPSFKLGGSVGLTALTLSGLSNGAALASAVLASVSAPIVDGGAAIARVAAQQAALEQSRAAYQNTVLTAVKEVEDALLALRNDQQRLGYLQQAASAADNASVLAQNRYLSGLIDFQTVLQTQRSLLSSQDSVAGVQAELSSDVVRLVKAVGGGWQ